jgi:hypothetical protein
MDFNQDQIAPKRAFQNLGVGKNKGSGTMV